LTYFGEVAASQARGAAARAALVEQAERLFAEHGIAGVSLRDVSAAAGQRNHSAAQYHFGDRHGLVSAVYEARMALVDERRQARLDAMDAAGRERDLVALAEAVLVPLLEVVAESEGWYARFLARTRWDPEAWATVSELATAGSLRSALRHLLPHLEHLPPALRRGRLDQVLTLVIGTAAGWEGAPDRGEPRLPLADLAADLVATTVALLSAPAPSAPLDILKGASA
jgi:AcrR family transcriptional regulator